MVGRHIVAELLATGVQVAILSRCAPQNLEEDVKWYQWDLTRWRNFDDLDSEAEKIDAVIHAGACVPGKEPVAPQLLFDANVAATMCLGSWAAEHKLPFVYLSGAVVYEDIQATGISESASITATGFGGFYRTTKLLGEQLLSGLYHGSDNLIVLRPTSIYGVGLDPEKMISAFLRSALQGDPIEISPPWNESVNLVHAADVAWAVIAAIEAAASGIFNIGGQQETVLGIAQAIQKIAGSGEIKKQGQNNPQQPVSSRFDVDDDKAARTFSYKPRVDLLAGIAMMRDNLLRPSIGGTPEC